MSKRGSVAASLGVSSDLRAAAAAPDHQFDGLATAAHSIAGRLDQYQLPFPLWWFTVGELLAHLGFDKEASIALTHSPS